MADFKDEIPILIHLFPSVKNVYYIYNFNKESYE